jgi:hypothetical protein
MPTLRQVFANLDTVEVVLGGAKFAARRLTGLEQDLISRIYPRPEPPMVPDLDRGSLAPPVPDTTDRVYLASDGGWLADFAMSVVAAALGREQLGGECEWPEVSPDTHRDAGVRAAAEAYLREARNVVQRVPWQEVLAAFNAIMRGPELPIEAAVKN